MPTDIETKGAPPLVELGVLDDLPFAGGFSQHELSIPWDALPIEEIQKMLDRDGQARTLLRVLTLPLRTANPVITEDDTQSEGTEEAEFVETTLTKPYRQGGMKTTWNSVTAHLGLALAFGYTIFEKVWMYDEETGRIRLRKLAHRSQKTCRFLLDRHGGLEGVRQRASWQGRPVEVDIPAEKVLAYTAQGEENPWYGKSLLTAAYYHHYKKERLYYLQNLAAQFHAVPGILGLCPPQATEKQRRDFNQLIARLRANSSGTASKDWDIHLIGGQGGMPNLVPIIDHHDSLMAKSVLAQFIQLGTGTNAGSWALSTDQSDLFLLSIQTILNEWADMFNYYLIPQLIDLNFTSRSYPTLSFAPVSDRVGEILAEAFKTAFGRGGLTPEFLLSIEQEMSEELGLGLDYEEIEQRMERENEMRRQAEEAMMRQQIRGIQGGGDPGTPALGTGE